MEHKTESDPGAGNAEAAIGKHINNTDFTQFHLPEQPGETTIATIQKGKKEIVRVNLFRMQSNDLVGIRTFAQLQDGTVVPTKKGLAMAVRHIPALREALQLAEAEIIRLGAGGAG
ncbi:MAG: PC4/YdbC family ssDNA-binding protein [Rhodospirillales bacterium]